ncbi:MAG TPA: hypothetical protein VG795_14910 [Acidimicrobiia bacterium]|nr:hypothetical protein [Acidimicrobiia bacterium]
MTRWAEGNGRGPDLRAGGSDGALVLGDDEVGWFEPFHDPLLDAVVLRLWLNAAALDSPRLRVLSRHLSGVVGGLLGRRGRPAQPTAGVVEANRIFPIAGAEPASVLLRFGSAPPRCGCQWRSGTCDEWFVEQLVASFGAGCRRLGASVAPERIRGYVVGELGADPGLQWWSLVHAGARSGLLISSGHEDLHDGRPFAQCVDAVGRHSAHFSCLAARLGADLGCEVRGEVTVGDDWDQERRVVEQLHAEGWRLRGLTSLFGPVLPEWPLSDRNERR